MLILSLPASADAQANEWAVVRVEGGQIVHHGRLTAAELADQGRTLVATVPASRLSWHLVDLPPNSHGARFTRVMQSLLEDCLLQPPENLHLVAAPGASAIARTGGQIQVAVCDPSWLRAALAPLQAVGVRPQRLLPEISPRSSTIYLTGQEPRPQVWWAHAQGVQPLPAQPSEWARLGVPAETVLRAEAAQVRWAQEQGLTPELQNAPGRWLQATESPWDLAQGEWGQSRRARMQRSLVSAWDAVAHAPEWRWARGGLAALIALQWLGIEWQAWQARSEQAQWQTQQQMLLQEAFPKVKVILDPPLQMAREVQSLRLARGQLGLGDLEPLLAALGQALEPPAQVTQLRYQGDRLTVEGLALDPQVRNRLRALGYRVQADGDMRWHLHPGETP